MSQPAFEIPAICHEIAERLKGSKRIIFSTHVYPDGDNLGSMLALMHGLTRLGIECRAHVGTHVPEYYGFMPDIARFVTTDLPPDRPEDYDCCVIVDSGDIFRMGDAFTAWRTSGKLEIINIDHHKSNTYFGTVNWVDPSYAAVGEQIVELLDVLGVAIDQTIGTCLMTSIMTDTGRFSFENTTLRTMTYATRIVEAGVTTYSIYRPVYQSKKLSGLRLQTLAMQTLKVDSSRKLAILHLTQAMLKESGALLEESEGIIDVVNAIDEVLMVCFFKEANPGDVKLSIRTKGDFDAVPVAMLFGGGGHARAAGSTIPGGGGMEAALAMAVPQIEAEVDRQLGRTLGMAAE